MSNSNLEKRRDRMKIHAIGLGYETRPLVSNGNSLAIGITIGKNIGDAIVVLHPKRLGEPNICHYKWLDDEIFFRGSDDEGRDFLDRIQLTPDNVIPFRKP